MEEVAAGSLDLAEVTHDPAAVRRLARRPMEAEELSAEPLVVVARAKGKWGEALAKHAERTPLGAAELAGLGAPLLLPEPTSSVRAGIDRAFAAAGLADGVEVALEAGGWGVLVGYAADGLGVAVVSAAGVGTAKGLVVRPLDEAAFPPSRTWLICRKLGGGLDLSPEADAFRAAVRAAAVHPAGS